MTAHWVVQYATQHGLRLLECRISGIECPEGPVSVDTFISNIPGFITSEDNSELHGLTWGS
jgi:hypothetical protein